ncbi:glycoside hydrolase family 3 protein [Sarocladium strictum]
MPTLEERRRVGQLFAVGFHSIAVDENITSLVRDYGVGAIVLFKRNVGDAQQLRDLCIDLQKIAKDAGHEHPLFIGIDQENGLVTRISPPVATQLPGPMAIGATGQVQVAHDVSKATGDLLQHFGINMNYAPVADVNSEPLNPVIGTRSPGDDPSIVAKHVSAAATGLRAASVVPCVKHFPGHGDTAVDSHYGLPVINKDRAAMDAVELIPFREAVKEGIEMVMTAHISLPQLTGSDLPATLSSEAIKILRKDLGFEGVIMTDCLEMDGIRATHGTEEGAAMAFEAGVDNVMICHTYEVQTGAVDRVCAALESGRLSRSGIEASLQRLATLKAKFTSWDSALKQNEPAQLASLNKESKTLADRVYADSATLVREAPGLLPLPRKAKTIFLSPGQNVPVGGAVDSGVVIQPTRVPWTASTFVNAIERYSPEVENIRFSDANLDESQWRKLEEAEVVIIATRNAKESPYQNELTLKVVDRLKSAKIAVVATCNPYDFLDATEVSTYLAAYEPTYEAFAATVDILYGAAKARGKLPVAHA